MTMRDAWRRSSCRKPIIGAKPVPGPIMMMGALVDDTPILLRCVKGICTSAQIELFHQPRFPSGC